MNESKFSSNVIEIQILSREQCPEDMIRLHCQVNHYVSLMFMCLNQLCILYFNEDSMCF